jgi:hypothetical protein
MVPRGIFGLNRKKLTEGWRQLHNGAKFVLLSKYYLDIKFCNTGGWDMQHA